MKVQGKKVGRQAGKVIQNVSLKLTLKGRGETRYSRDKEMCLIE
jgi:hypothetical protein